MSEMDEYYDHAEIWECDETYEDEISCAYCFEYPNCLECFNCDVHCECFEEIFHQPIYDPY